MQKTTQRILRSDEVKLEGQFHLETGQTVSTSANKINTAAVPIQVCIVENNPEFAVMEVTCSCGEKIQVRCEYATANSIE